MPTPEGCTCIHQHMDHGRGVCTIPLCPCEAGTHDGPTPETPAEKKLLDFFEEAMAKMTPEEQERAVDAVLAIEPGTRTATASDGWVRIAAPTPGASAAGEPTECARCKGMLVDGETATIGTICGPCVRSAWPAPSPKPGETEALDAAERERLHRLGQRIAADTFDETLKALRSLETRGYLSLADDVRALGAARELANVRPDASTDCKAWDIGGRRCLTHNSNRAAVCVERYSALAARRSRG